MIYKLFRPPEWEAARGAAHFKGSPVDLADGFLHFSTSAQVRSTAAKHFAGVADLVLAEIDPARLPQELKWEPARGQLFPHLYEPLPLAAIARTWTLALGPDGKHVFPDLGR